MRGPDHVTKYRLLRLFNEGSSVTYHQIEEHLGIGERQARRLLQRLRSDGVPVEEVRVGRAAVLLTAWGHCDDYDRLFSPQARGS